MGKKETSKKDSSTDPIKWAGTHTFYIAGTDHEDDTVRIPSSHRQDEVLYQLILPTLCITYADMRFANDIGGVQADYPDSKVYGEEYFDPPIELNGAEAIEKFTWIRGAERVTIGPKDTVIEWWGWRDLVIPKLRIRPQAKVKALLTIPGVIITVSQPFVARVQQYADGRHVGGIQVTKRHHRWKPEPKPQLYALFLRVIDGRTRRAIPEAEVTLRTWDDQKNGFVPEATFFTNGMGIVDVADLPCSDKKLILVERSPWLPQTWRFRPLPGQNVRKIFRLWKPTTQTIPYVWRLQDTLQDIATLTGSSRIAVLRMNRLRSASELTPGTTIDIPCFAAIHHVEARDTLERLAAYFCYDDLDELARVNAITKPYTIHEDQELRLPGWRFFQAKRDDLFERIDEQFGVPGGWSRPAQRVLHDDPTRAYEHEVIAVPTVEFTRKHNLRRLY